MNTESIECVTCNEVLINPRPLFCGHSYCGPRREYLETITNDNGGLRCAVCLVEHDMETCDTNTLYEIPDFYKEVQSR